MAHERTQEHNFWLIVTVGPIIDCHAPQSGTVACIEDNAGLFEWVIHIDNAHWRLVEVGNEERQKWVGNKDVTLACLLQKCLFDQRDVLGYGLVIAIHKSRLEIFFGRFSLTQCWCALYQDAAKVDQDVVINATLKSLEYILRSLVGCCMGPTNPTDRRRQVKIEVQQ